MKIVVRTLLVAILCIPSVTLFAQDSDVKAVSCIVSGKVQKVGFRAMILKQAIAFNLAGTAKNSDDGKTVEFVLQGDSSRIAEALPIIGKGTSKSSDVKLETSDAKVDDSLKTFTVIDWTSTSRKITKPYNLNFTLREDDTEISAKEAKKVYHKILHDTLDHDDLEKLSDEGD